MNRHEYQCPYCNGKDISFLKIENIGMPKEEVIFFCNFCKKKFRISGLRAEYLPNLVAILKEKYPPNEMVKPP